MTIFEMLEQSGSVTLLGMGMVFSFLILMVLSVSIVGKVFQTLGANRDTGLLQAVNAAQGSSPVNTSAVVAAVTAALTEYQKDTI